MSDDIPEANEEWFKKATLHLPDRKVDDRIEEITHGSFRSVVMSGALGEVCFTRVEKSECLAVTVKGNHALDEDQTRYLMDWLKRQFDPEF